MNQQFFRLIRLVFIILDLFMINIAFILVRHLLSSKILPDFEVQYAYLWMFINIAWIAVGWFCSIYSINVISSFEIFSRRSGRAYIYFIVVLLLYHFFSKQFDIARSFILVFFVSLVFGILINRLIYLFILHFFRNRDHLIRKIVIVGYNDISKKLAQQLEEDSLNTKIIGYCENEQGVHELSNYPIIGGLTDIIEVSQQHKATEIYSTIAPDQNEAIYQLMQKADQACIRFKLVPNFSFFTRFPVHIDYVGSIPVLSLRKEPLDDVANRIRKRLYDLAFSSLVIIFILSWMIPLIGLLIFIESRGPVFFVQMRSGKDNRPFRCLKFRSMRINRESNLQQASREDQRVTKIGKFLRQHNLDEFPQFLNVLIGSMSVVGPRPHMLKHTNDYSSIIKKYMIRQFTKPGITGWAQVNGFRGETRSVWDMERRVENDIWYMENWSLWLDTRIVFLTLFNMLRGDKNAF